LLSFKKYQALIKTFCVYDVLALLPMAIPIVNAQHLTTLSQINMLLGGQAWEEFSATQLLFVQMLGLLGTAWAIWRWRNLTVAIGRYEGGLRLLFSATLFWGYFLTLHPILLLFAVIDLIAGLLHLVKTDSPKPINENNFQD
jgi:hypothetical protein